MKKLFAAAALAGTALTSVPAMAQDAQSLEYQVAALVAEVSRLNQRVAELETQQTEVETQQANVAIEQAAIATQVATMRESVPAATAPATAPSEPSWAGAPEFEAEGGWSFKPFGRLNIDGGTVNIPDSTGRTDGFGSEIRRARVGLGGDIPGGFGYKIEVDFAGDEVAITDAIITYDDGPLTLTVGQHNNFQSLEELTSSRWSSFMERAAFTDAFGFERRLGVSAQVDVTDTIILQAGVFTDNIAELPGDTWSGDARIVASPKMGDAQLHLGGSVHYTDVPDGDTVRYRQRPLVHFTSERFINTGDIGASSEFSAGLEAGIISGPFHAVGEAFWQTANLPGALGEDANFFGGYAEVGMFLTPGDRRGYKGGKFDRTRPANPVDEGGMGAFQINARYDYLDLTDADAGIIGGTQNGYFASLVWVPTDYTRLTFNYGRLQYSDAVYATASGSRDYSVDVLGMRAQIDF